MASFIGEPYDWGGRYMAAYLAFPVVTTAVLALLWRHVRKSVVVALATPRSVLAFAFLYSLVWEVHSTASIGLLLALVVYSWFSVATVIAVRAAQCLMATSPPAASS
ncbi:MAG: hypothetical protein IR159_05140 [Brevundimonas sp.]|nr:hypothetical protein [Brevundimonas sp.]